MREESAGNCDRMPLSLAAVRRALGDFKHDGTSFCLFVFRGDAFYELTRRRGYSNRAATPAGALGRCPSRQMSPRRDDRRTRPRPSPRDSLPRTCLPQPSCGRGRAAARSRDSLASPRRQRSRKASLLRRLCKRWRPKLRNRPLTRRMDLPLPKPICGWWMRAVANMRSGPGTGYAVLPDGKGDRRGSASDRRRRAETACRRYRPDRLDGRLPRHGLCRVSSGRARIDGADQRSGAPARPVHR